MMRTRPRQLMLGLAGLLTALALFPPGASAGSEGTAGAAFLKLGTGARPAAMGGTYVGIAEDVYGMHWNPAGLARISHLQLGAQHLNQYLGVSYEYMGGAMPLGERFTVGADLLMMQTEDFVRTELEDLGSFTNRDQAFGLSVAAKVTDEFSVGVSGRAISQKMESWTASGWAADLGAYYRPNDSPWSFGAAALNLGPDLVFEQLGDPLPRVLKAGAGYRAFSDQLLLAAEVSYPNDGAMYGSLGMEYWLIPELALRAGYEVNSDFKGIDAASAGLAVQYGMFAIDYAFVPRERLGYIHRIGLRLDFDMINRAPAPAAGPDRPAPAVMPVPEPAALPTPVSLRLPTPRPAPAPARTPAPAPVPLWTVIPAPAATAPVPVAAGPRRPVTPALASAPIPPRSDAGLATLYYKQGVAHFRVREYAAAIADFSAAQRFEPEALDIHYALSVTYYEAGDYDRSLREIEQVWKQSR